MLLQNSLAQFAHTNFNNYSAFNTFDIHESEWKACDGKNECEKRRESISTRIAPALGYFPAAREIFDCVLTGLLPQKVGGVRDIVGRVSTSARDVVDCTPITSLQFGGVNTSAARKNFSGVPTTLLPLTAPNASNIVGGVPKAPAFGTTSKAARCLKGNSARASLMSFEKNPVIPTSTSTLSQFDNMQYSCSFSMRSVPSVFNWRRVDDGPKVSSYVVSQLKLGTHRIRPYSAYGGIRELNSSFDFEPSKRSSAFFGLLLFANWSHSLFPDSGIFSYETPFRVKLHDASVLDAQIYARVASFCTLATSIAHTCPPLLTFRGPTDHKLFRTPWPIFDWPQQCDFLFNENNQCALRGQTDHKSFRIPWPIFEWPQQCDFLCTDEYQYALRQIHGISQVSAAAVTNAASTTSEEFVVWKAAQTAASIAAPKGHCSALSNISAIYPAYQFMQSAIWSKVSVTNVVSHFMNVSKSTYVILRTSN